MGAGAYAEKLTSRYSPYPQYEPGFYGLCGLFVAYLTVLALGVFAFIPIDRFEAAMNATVFAGFAVPYAYFWRLRRRSLKAVNPWCGNVRRCFLHDAATLELNKRPEVPARARALSGGQWGTACIGFINE
jgi:hypothetical protein